MKRNGNIYVTLHFILTEPVELGAPKPGSCFADTQGSELLRMWG
jgi:hypothetical protein